MGTQYIGIILDRLKYPYISLISWKGLRTLWESYPTYFDVVDGTSDVAAHLSFQTLMICT